MTRVAIYARYSDDKQSAHSIEDQVRICRLHADKQDWRVVSTYSDAAISGSTVILRPGVQALLRDALAGEFDVVLAEAMDRLSRDQEDIAGLFKRLRFAGVPIVTLSEGEVSELHVGLKGTMNALFLKDLAAKTHRGNRGRVEAGKVAGGNSYGYKVVREIDVAGKVTTGEREIIPYEADIVRRIFRDYVAGKSPRQICIELNAEGVASPRGRAWGEMTIRGHLSIQSGILNNHFYIGQMVWNRRRDVRNPDTGRARHRVNPQSEWVYAQAPHLRIIDDDLWNAAKARQEHHARAYRDAVARGAQSFQAAATSRRPQTLLSGLITCGLCGGTVAKRGNNRLACVAHIKGQGCTNASAVRSDSLEARVLVGLRERLMAPEVMAEAMRAFIEETNRLNHHRRANETADRLRLEKARKAIAGIVSAIEDGGYTRPLMERLKSLDAEVETIERTLAEAPRDVPDVHPNVAELYRRKVERLVEALNNPADRTEAATALRALIEKVVVTPTGRRGEADVRLFGDLETVLAWAEDKEVGFRSPATLFLRAAGDGLSVPASDRSGTGVRRPGPPVGGASESVRRRAKTPACRTAPEQRLHAKILRARPGRFAPSPSAQRASA
ncbi:recombinase family protein [Caulobacter sp. Root1455]|uniref:recombinase family protein n=1 Tax=Caulobacter sp. Root1455 TaxID=1736465 RepID=UPI0009E67B71|nr:recombinase family protein [Caulobacter sp. Root1455]